MSKTTVEIKNAPAIFWDGQKRLSGTLEIRESSLVFNFDDFNNTNLNLEIPLKDIESLKIILIFSLAKNGLQIKSKLNKSNIFVLEECEQFYRILREKVFF